jgi:hypothetical protein
MRLVAELALAAASSVGAGRACWASVLAELRAEVSLARGATHDGAACVEPGGAFLAGYYFALPPCW